MSIYQLNTITGNTYLFESDTNNMVGILNRGTRTIEVKTTDGKQTVFVVDNIESVKKLEG